MPCFSPLHAFQTVSGEIVFKNTGIRPIRRALQLPCGQCIGCRLERSRQWAVRCMHEASLHERNCFITLTYDEQHLPDRGSLDYSHFQLFAKRMRKRLGPFRFYMCGEYGERYGRPHFHAALFGLDFPDWKYLRKLPSGCTIGTSEVLSSLWDAGFASIGQLTFESAAYIARYVTKKVTGEAASTHYCRTDLDTGEIYSITPEFTRMSLKPGIGADWFEKYQSDVYPRDFVVTNGAKAKPPRYYDKKLEAVAPGMFEAIKESREKKAKACAENNSPARLRVRETCTRARLSFKQRSLD